MVNFILLVEDYANDSYYENYKLEKSKTETKETLDKALEYIDKCYEQIDIVILDIDLQLGNKKKCKELLRNVVPDKTEIKKSDAGFYVFLKLLYKGFPIDRIAFLTGNKSLDGVLFNKDIFELLDSTKALEENAKEIINSKAKFDKFIEFLKNNDFEDLLDFILELQANKDTDGIIEIISDIVEDTKKDMSLAKNNGTNITKQTFEEWKAKFDDLGMTIPEGFRKDFQSEHFIKWKQERVTRYYKLRRGIIEGCIEIEKILHKGKSYSHIGFQYFIDNRDENKSKIFKNKSNYYKLLSTLRKILPLRMDETSNSIEVLYNQFLTILSKDWEAVRLRFNYSYDQKNKHDHNDKNLSLLLDNAPTYNIVMKTLRNWIAHSRINKFSEADVAFLFIIAMRTFFKLENKVYEYESLLLDLINESPKSKEFIKEYISLKNYQLKKDLVRLYKAMYNNTNKERNSALYMATRIKELGHSNRKLDMSILYKLFWHSKFREKLYFDNNSENIELQFDYASKDLKKCNDEILIELFRHTYDIVLK